MKVAFGVEGEGEMKNKLLVMKKILLLFLVLLLCACKENTSSDVKDGIVLNERQKSILEKKGLSTEYEDLTYSQQQAIVSIEELLQVLETKYGEEFSYDSYREKSILENEYLIAYPSGGENAGLLVMIMYRKNIILEENWYGLTSDWTGNVFLLHKAREKGRINYLL